MLLKESLMQLNTSVSTALEHNTLGESYREEEEQV